MGTTGSHADGVSSVGSGTKPGGLSPVSKLYTPESLVMGALVC
jgi:hypothetical protein